MITTSKTTKVITNTVMILLCLCCVLPFLLLIGSSLSSDASLLKYGYRFIPREFSTAAYDYLFGAKEILVRAYGMTILVTAIGTIANITLTMLIAYPLSRKDMPGRGVLSFFVFFTMLFHGGMVPSYIIWTQIFHIKDTIWGQILPNYMLSAFNIIMMRTYFTTNIPGEIIDASRIDGASELQILGKIVLPLSKPIVSTIALMTALVYWNDWTNGLYYITRNTKLYTIQNVLNTMVSNAQFLATQANAGQLLQAGGAIPNVSTRMAVAVIAVIPILIIYPFFQKSFVKGIVIGGVKG